MAFTAPVFSATAARTALTVAAHQSAGFCSTQPGRGVVEGVVGRARAPHRARLVYEQGFDARGAQVNP